KRVFLVILFTSFSGSLVSRIPGAVQLTFVTNEDGIVTVPSLHIGQWLAKVQNKKSFQDKSLCDETVDVATLSFSRN
ncbi:hypothetical protein QP282_24265, partial [Escherichia coli]